MVFLCGYVGVGKGGVATGLMTLSARHLLGIRNLRAKPVAVTSWLYL